MSETSIAFLTAACMLPGHPDEREDLFEHELEFAALQKGCAEQGLRLHEVVWDADDWRPEDHAACVIGTTWDYAEREDAFLQRLAEIDARSRLLNGLGTVRWNRSKRYLADLEARGIAIVPTRFVDTAEEGVVRAAARDLGAERFVVKPVVGACSWRQALLGADDPWPEPGDLPPEGCLVQPFLPAAEEEGEVSLVAIGGAVSHALRKIPASGDYRTQSVFGAREVVHEPAPDEVAAAEAALACTPEPCLYARVDLMRDPAGVPRLMELELIEPYLYPEQGPDLGSRFADALLRTLGT